MVDMMGNLAYVNGAGPYVWPTNSAEAGDLHNDGSGGLSWTPPSVASTNAVIATNAPDGYALLSTNSSLNAAKLVGAVNLGSLDWSQTNSVITNGIARKVPVFTNDGTVFYLMLTTNVP